MKAPIAVIDIYATAIVHYTAVIILSTTAVRNHPPYLLLLLHFVTYCLVSTSRVFVCNYVCSILFLYPLLYCVSPVFELAMLSSARTLTHAFSSSCTSLCYTISFTPVSVVNV